MVLIPNLSDRVALVTGASRGIGRAVALALAAAGADIAVNYRRQEAAADEVAAAIRATGRRAIAVSADVSDRGAVAAMIGRIEAELGAVDVLVNNAGIAITRGVDDLTEAEFDLTLTVNLKSAFLCTQAVLPGMRARRWGRIVNISSGAARGAGGIGVHYNASKAGMEGLTRGYAARLVKEGITGECRGAIADRYRHDERAARPVCRTHSARTHGDGGGGGAGGTDGGGERIHDRADGATERRDELRLGSERRYP